MDTTECIDIVANYDYVKATICSESFYDLHACSHVQWNFDWKYCTAVSLKVTLVYLLAVTFRYIRCLILFDCWECCFIWCNCTPFDISLTLTIQSVLYHFLFVDMTGSVKNLLQLLSLEFLFWGSDTWWSNSGIETNEADKEIWIELNFSP